MKKLSQELLVTKVVERRKQKGLTQQQLADLTGINRALLSRLETSDFISFNCMFSYRWFYHCWS